MSAPGPERVDVDGLADSGASLSRRYPLARFGRLADALAAPSGEAVASFEFGRTGEGLASCAIEVSATATLCCQRCFEAFEQPLISSARIAFVPREADAGGVPEDCEAVVAAEGRVDLGELVEEELLLALPIVAMHGGGTRCAASTRQAADDEGEGEVKTHRPFAQLQDLLKH